MKKFLQPIIHRFHLKQKLKISAILLFFSISSFPQAGFEAIDTSPIMFDLTYDPIVPNKIYAITHSNHILVSNDHGLHWNVLYSSPHYLSKLRLGNQPNTITFASNGQGILTYNTITNHIESIIPAAPSGLGSETWVNNYNMYNNNTIIEEVMFRIGNDVFSKVFYTSDAGLNWREVYFNLDDAGRSVVNTVAIAPSNPQKIIMTIGTNTTNDSNGLWISEDAGITFTKTFSDKALGPIAFNPNNPQEILLGTAIKFGGTPQAENLYKSIDGGNTWSIVNIDWASTSFSLNCINFIGYDRINPNKIIVLEENEIVSSLDAGATWNREIFDLNISTEYNYGLWASFDPFNNNRTVITTNYYPQITSDYGSNLTQIMAPFMNVYSASVDQNSGNTHVYYCSRGGYLHKNTSTGQTSSYNILPPMNISQSTYNIIADPVVAGRSIILDSYESMGSIVKLSTSYGASPMYLFSSPGSDIQVVTVDPSNTNKMYLALSMATDSGQSIGLLYKIDISDPENIITTEITVPPLGRITGILIGTDNPDMITISMLNSILVSDDAGLNWSSAQTTGIDYNGFSNILDLKRSQSNPNHIMLATNNGIYVSTDDGATWSLTLEGTIIHKLSYSPYNSNEAVAATYSSLVTNAQFAVTTNHGATWTNITPETLLHAKSNSMDFAYTQQAIKAYIATNDLGLFSYEVDLNTLGTNNPSIPSDMNSVVLYPNPATDVIKIKVSDNSNLLSVSIYSLTGQKVLETVDSSINISMLSNGVYMIRCIMANGVSYTQKLMKQ